jgi:hypothetical protein
MLSIQSKAQDLMEMLKAAERVHENSRKKRGRREHVKWRRKSKSIAFNSFLSFHLISLLIP